MLPRDRVRTSPTPCTTTALQENEYEIHNRHALAHDICHNRCGCAGWNRAWSAPLADRADHRHATTGICADDCFADKAAVEAFPAQVGISFDDEIREPAQARSRTGCVRIGPVAARDATADSDHLNESIRAPSPLPVGIAHPGAGILELAAFGVAI